MYMRSIDRFIHQSVNRKQLTRGLSLSDRGRMGRRDG
jgi:hypothetical protein